MTTLHDLLWNLTADDLRYRLKFLNPGLKPTRKADLIDGIKAALAGPGLAAALNDLDETGRLAVMEAVHEASHRHLPTRFMAKYGRDAKFHLIEANARTFSSYPTPANATRLNVFFYSAGDRDSPVIPTDLVERLQTLVPAPTPFTVPCISEPVAEDGLLIRLTESEALTEFGALLRLAAAGGLAFGPKTGIPAKNAITGIEASLVGGDWFPPELMRLEDAKPWEQEIGSIKSVGWTRMLQVAGLVAMTGSKSVLTPQGRRAVEKPAWEVIAGIWRKWSTNKEYDEFNRIDVIKGKTVKGALTARVPRRSVALAALTDCPAGEWMTFEGFSNYMRAEDFMFEVSTDPWKLYIADRQYGSLGYSGYAAWETLQDRYLLCWIMEYAATLGIVDIAYKNPKQARPMDSWGMDNYAWLSRYDGLQAFRINPLGAYILSMGETPFQPSHPAPQVRLKVLSNRTIHVVSGDLSATERLQLETWAERESDGVFRLDDFRAIEAIETGQEPEGFARFLEERDDQPLPETITAFLEQARFNGRAVRQSGNAILFECANSFIAEQISQCKEVKAFCYRAGETTLAVREESLTKFRKQVHLLGLGFR
jgi:hypothetical protein